MADFGEILFQLDQLRVGGNRCLRRVQRVGELLKFGILLAEVGDELGLLLVRPLVGRSGEQRLNVLRQAEADRLFRRRDDARRL